MVFVVAVVMSIAVALFTPSAFAARRLGRFSISHLQLERELLNAQHNKWVGFLGKLLKGSPNVFVLGQRG